MIDTSTVNLEQGLSNYVLPCLIVTVSQFDTSLSHLFNEMLQRQGGPTLFSTKKKSYVTPTII